MLDRASILAASDFRYAEVEVPEWGGSVRLRTMSGSDRDAYSAGLLDESGKFDPKRFRQARLLAFSLVGEDGARLFTEADIDALNGKSAEVIARLFEAAERLNGIGERAVEDAEKNSSPGPSGASS